MGSLAPKKPELVSSFSSKNDCSFCLFDVNNAQCDMTNISVNIEKKHRNIKLLCITQKDFFVLQRMECE